MNIKTLEVTGLEPALHAMRNPMDSWNKSDSKWVDIGSPTKPDKVFTVGENDKDLSERLQKSGPEHCKHLRMVMVYADIKAARYWWNEFDTYRTGVEKVSCSTMHKLMTRPLCEDDFEHDSMNKEFLSYVIESINTSMEAWRFESDQNFKKDIWRSIIQGLPQSYLQKRTVMMSYAALRNIVKQREGHKLNEWKQFIDWCHTLPESWMIFDD